MSLRTKKECNNGIWSRANSMFYIQIGKVLHGLANEFNISFGNGTRLDFKKEKKGEKR